MRLYLNPPSPYARKVLVTAHELGLADGVEVCAVDPWLEPAELLAIAPVGKVSALEFVPGRVLIGSSAICAYLGCLAGRTLPPEA